jgi:4-amino-4-deoxy-L-arabinose transferase-like glycosyltransferase
MPSSKNCHPKTFSNMHHYRLHTCHSVWIFVLALTVFSGFLMFAPDRIRNKLCGDCETWYIPLAENILSGKGLVTRDGRRALDRPPGHVLILATTMGLGDLAGVSRNTAIYAFNVIALSVSTVLLFFITFKFWGIRSAWVISILWMSNPFVLWFLNQPYTEVPFFCTLYASVLCLVYSLSSRANKLSLVFLVGTLLGLSTLIRPIAFGLIFVFGVIIWLQTDNSQLKPKLMLIGFLLIGLLITVTPWATYVKYHTGKFTLQPNNAHAVGSLVEGLTFGTRKKGYRIGIPLRPDVKAFMEEMETIFFHYQTLPNGPKLYGPGGNYDIQKPRNVVRIALTKGLDKPIVFMRLTLLKLTRAWYGTDSNRGERIASYLQVVYFLAIIPAIVLILYRRENYLLARIAIGISLYFWLLASIFTPLVRYMIPALGLLLTLIPALWSNQSPKQLVKELGRP